ncbi:hypothetical protein PMAYCL1PPCAC_00197, partial [Pristionchus mayeri]
GIFYTKAYALAQRTFPLPLRTPLEYSLKRKHVSKTLHMAGSSRCPIGNEWLAQCILSISVANCSLVCLLHSTDEDLETEKKYLGIWNIQKSNAKT